MMNAGISRPAARRCVSLRVCLVALGVTALQSPSHAAQELLPVVEEATIVDVTAGSRVLVRFGSLDHLQQEWIRSATLHLPLVGAFPSPVTVQVDIPQTPWTSGATWDTPWTESGGDPFGEEPATKLVPAGLVPGALSIDVTSLVRSIQRQETPDHGFLIWPLDPHRTGFSPLEMAALGARSLATLEVTYRKISVHGITP